jgi:hypothetical protein
MFGLSGDGRNVRARIDVDGLIEEWMELGPRPISGKHVLALDEYNLIALVPGGIIVYHRVLLVKVRANTGVLDAAEVLDERALVKCLREAWRELHGLDLVLLLEILDDQLAELALVRHGARKTNEKGSSATVRFGKFGGQFPDLEVRIFLNADKCLDVVFEINTPSGASLAHDISGSRLLKQLMVLAELVVDIKLDRLEVAIPHILAEHLSVRDFADDLLFEPHVEDLLDVIG